MIEALTGRMNMNKPILVIMAAGMGSRYGGLKQIDPVDEKGHIIIDFLSLKKRTKRLSGKLSATEYQSIWKLISYSRI